MSTDSLLRYRHAVAYIDGLANLPRSDDYMSGRSRPIIFLQRTKAFLDMLGNPEKDFKYVHITGTAGKGTVASMVYESLVYEGKHVGTFTSPFVVAASEKIRANVPGEGDFYIAPDEFADIVEALKPAVDTLHRENPLGRPSYFELYFALSLLYFKKKKCEWVVLEVGAGGRFDATNVIESPVAAAITCIDYDHTKLLGRTLASIAHNKVGIVKRNSILFTTERRQKLLKIFEKECRKVSAEFRPLPVGDNYQKNNETLAFALCKHIGLSHESAVKGVLGARLPCRFETVQHNPTIVLDGAHNRSKMRSTIANVRAMPHKKLHVVLGFKGEKDVRTMLQELVPLAHHVYATRFQLPGLKCADPNSVARDALKFTDKGTSVDVFLDPGDALDAARESAQPDDLILVTGSFYLAGELRREWYSEEWVVKNRRSFR